MQFLQQMKKHVSAHTNAWEYVESAQVKSIMKAQGRHSMMSPLPEEVPSGIKDTVSDRPSVCSPLSTEHEEMSAEMREIQDAINSHSLSPRSASYRESLPCAPRKSHLRPPQHRAKLLQKQFGDALDRANESPDADVLTSPKEHKAVPSQLAIKPIAMKTLETDKVPIIHISDIGSTTPMCHERIKIEKDTPESGYNSEASSAQGSNASLFAEKPVTHANTVPTYKPGGHMRLEAEV